MSRWESFDEDSPLPNLKRRFFNPSVYPQVSQLGTKRPVRVKVLRWNMDTQKTQLPQAQYVVQLEVPDDQSPLHERLLTSRDLLLLLASLPYKDRNWVLPALKTDVNKVCMGIWVYGWTEGCQKRHQ